MFLPWPMLDTFAGTGVSAPPVPTEMPDGATVHLDFVAQEYAIDGFVVAAADILGGGFDAANIDANGLLVDDDVPDAVPAAIGSLLDAIKDGMVNGMVYMVEFYETETDEYFPTLVAISGSTIDGSTDAFWMEYANYNDTHTIRDFDGLHWQTAITGPSVPSTNRVACLVASDNGDATFRYGVSVNGAAASQTDTDHAQTWTPVTHVWLFGERNNAGRMPLAVHIRSLTIWPPDTIANLPSYSAA